jgi:hypothetical protein
MDPVHRGVQGPGVDNPPPHIGTEVIQANDVNRGCTSKRSYLVYVQAFVRPSVRT